MYSLKVYVLNNCYYCNQTKLLLKNNNIKAKIITVKEDQKYKYKNKDISTFPMIYLLNKKKKILAKWKKKDIIRLLSILN